jgi:DNA-binding PadR family transcriptional regulator
MAKRIRITTTSHAILGLLAVEPGTAYDLTKRMTRNYHFIWPRAESKLFEEVKRLQAAGLASAHAGATGQRRHTRYAITAAGRRALHAWVPTPSAEPLLEFEALLKIAYADFAGKRALERQLAAIEAHAGQMRGFGEAIARSLLAGEPWRRSGTQSLLWRFLWDHYGAMEAWAAWARAEVRAWKSTAQSDTPSPRALAVLRRAIRPADRRRGGRARRRRRSAPPGGRTG